MRGVIMKETDCQMCIFNGLCTPYERDICEETDDFSEGVEDEDLVTSNQWSEFSYNKYCDNLWNYKINLKD